MSIKGKNIVTVVISSSYNLLGQDLVLLCRLSLFAVYAIFVLEMGNQVCLLCICKLYILTCLKNLAKLVVKNDMKDIQNGNCTVSRGVMATPPSAWKKVGDFQRRKHGGQTVGSSC